MTKDSIIHLPNKHLRSKSKKITVIDKNIKQVIEMMKAATIDWDKSREHEIGVALAAVQIDQLYRIIIIRDDHEEKENSFFNVFINPRVTKYEGQLVDDYEGCLSVPEIYGKVPRYEKVHVSAIDENANAVKVVASDFMARIFQHEIDHTNGKLFIDHIKDQPEAFYKLTKNGNLKKVDYEKDIRKNNILW